MCNCNKRKQNMSSAQALAERAERIAAAGGAVTASASLPPAPPWPGETTGDDRSASLTSR